MRVEVELQFRWMQLFLLEYRARLLDKTREKYFAPDQRTAPYIVILNPLFGESLSLVFRNALKRKEGFLSGDDYSCAATRDSAKQNGQFVKSGTHFCARPLWAAQPVSRLVGGAWTGWLLLAEMARQTLTSILIAGAHSDLRPDGSDSVYQLKRQPFGSRSAPGLRTRSRCTRKATWRASVAKAIDQHQDLLQWSHLNFSYNPRMVWKAFGVPLHPGAVLYNRERGYMNSGTMNQDQKRTL